MAVAREFARKALTGELSAYEAARDIWWKVHGKAPHLKQLTTFVGAASEYEDSHEHREHYSRVIIELCAELLKSSPEKL